MLLLLPPSETKRPGGADGTKLTYRELGFPELTSARRAVVEAVRRLARDPDAAAAALRLGPRQRDEIAANRAILRSPVLPALDRYDGVLYDALDAGTLSRAERAFAGRHVAIASAAFGLTLAEDPIPAYRLSHDSRLPGLSLPRHWRAPLADLLAATPGLLLDLRSEAYAALGPLPGRDDAVFVRVVSQGEDGRRRALNHFNKAGKGAFTRRVLEAGVVHESVDALLDWAHGEGIVLERSEAGELELVV